MNIEYDDTGSLGRQYGHESDREMSTSGRQRGATSRAFRAFVARFADILQTTSDPRSIVDGISQLLANHYGACACSAFLYGDADDLVAFVCAGLRTHFAREVERLGQTRWITDYLARDSRPATIGTSAEGQAASPFHRAARAEGIETVVSVPLDRGHGLLGVILLYWRESRQLAPSDIAELGSLAALTALALDNARMIETRKWERTAQDQFLNMLSHELRTPLTSIMGFTQIIRRRMGITREIDTRMRDQLDLLWAQSQRLNRLLDTFVDITNIERGDFVIAHDPVDVAGVLRTALEQSRTQSHRGHDLMLDIPDRPIYILGDEKRLEHMFGHLLSNAFRYSPEHQPVSVSCTSLAGAESVEVSIQDQGPGIPAELKREIFKRFYPSVTRKAGGLGVGLYVSRAIAEAHGGMLEIDSSPGAGTTVTVHLPTT